jgi:Flp pilus assembly pilin Flp
MKRAEADDRRLEMWTLCKTLWARDEGQDLTEYALILVLISLVAVSIVRTIGSVVYNSYSNASSNLLAAS